MKHKQYSMKLNDYFKLNKPNYVYLKLIPNTSIRNHKTNTIAEIINGLYLDVVERFKKHNKGFSYTLPAKVSFIIDIFSDNACFYLVVPEVFVKQFKQKLTDTFGKITIDQVEGIQSIYKYCTKYSMDYARDDVMSLSVDKRENELLEANLSVMDILQDDDRLTIIYNFIPQSKLSLASWKSHHADMMKKYKEGRCLDKTFTLNKVVLAVSNILFCTIDTLVNTVNWICGNEEKNDDLRKRFIPVQELTKTTIKKENAEIVKTQIMLLSQSKDETREKDNMKTLINTFSVAGEGADNKLIAKKVIDKDKPKSIGIKKTSKSNLSRNKKVEENKMPVFNVEEHTFNCDIMRMSTDEIGSNAILVPGKTLIEEYHLEAVQHVETMIPDELQNGSVRYGENTFRGKTTTVTTSTNEDSNCMPVIVMAKMGGGKSTFFENNGVDAIKNNEGLIVIDFIKNCELSDNIISNIPKEKTIVIDFSDYACSEGFSFNEINMIRDMKDPMSRYECAGLQNALITQFIDSLGEEEFSASMGRYLDAACSAVLIHENKTIKDIVKCLEDYKARAEYMQQLEKFKQLMPEEYQELIDDDLTALEELNEYRDVKVNNKKTGEVEVSGTSSSKISGILSRVSQLKKNPALKFMYARKPKNNINLAQLMQEGKAIFFKLPQNKFSSVTSKNVMVSYLFSKIEMAGIVRSEVYK